MENLFTALVLFTAFWAFFLLAAFLVSAAVQVKVRFKARRERAKRLAMPKRINDLNGGFGLR